MTDRTKIKFTIPVLILLSAFINYYVASRGAFPVDTFVHFDNGFRILTPIIFLSYIGSLLNTENI